MSQNHLRTTTPTAKATVCGLAAPIGLGRSTIHPSAAAQIGGRACHPTLLYTKGIHGWLAPPLTRAPLFTGSTDAADGRGGYTHTAPADRQKLLGVSLCHPSVPLT